MVSRTGESGAEGDAEQLVAESLVNGCDRDNVMNVEMGECC